jgi:ATP-dependent Clp protease ATP-binding subunit ClpC
MTFERFTDRARKVLQLARQEAQRFGRDHVDTAHVLLGLCKEGSGVAANVLKNLGVSLGKIRDETEKVLPAPGGPVEDRFGNLPLTDAAKKVVEAAIKESEGLHHNYQGTEHLLLGLLRDPESAACKVLTALGLTLERVRAETLNVLGPAEEEEGAPATEARQANDRLLTDLAATFLFVRDVGGWQRAAELLAMARTVAGESSRAAAWTVMVVAESEAEGRGGEG